MIPTAADALSDSTGNILRTILVVEDEKAIRESTSEFLRECGYIVIEAGDVTEAENLLLNWRVDLVFSDVNLPNRESGFALERWIHQSYPGVKVLLTSGFPQVSADTQHLREPIIAKPYSYTALLNRIDLLFESDGNVHR